jgi:two-component system phosphate regulon sensor histidine kinase PhoR
VRSRIFLKLMAAFFLVVGATTITMYYTVHRAWNNSLRAEIESSLVQKTKLFALQVENNKNGSLQKLVKEEAQAAGARATIIDSSGWVLADSDADPATMENHATRPEFVDALQKREGEAVRHSHTIGVDFLYVAVPIDNGAVRLAYPLSSIRAITSQVGETLLKGSALALLPAILIASIAAHLVAKRLQRIVKFAEQISAGDLSARVAESSFDEVAQVASALDKTARQLEQSFHELQSSRSQLETLLNSLQEGVIAFSPQQKLQWTNRSMQHLLPAEARAGISAVEAIRDPDFMHGLKQTLERHEVTASKATSFIPGRAFDVTIAPLPQGGAVAVFHDITEIERVEKTRRDFIANVSHELRTPLTSIHGYTETLLEAVHNGKHSRDFLEIIRKNTVRMSRLTEDLLTLARVESGEQRFDPQPVSARQLLEEAVQNFASLAHARGVTLALEECGDAVVMADREAIQQVFTNLIDNALKYAGEGQKVFVGMRETQRGCEFYVRDFGPGIASEHLPRLFERFYRVDKARSRETGGTGLGLAIVKHIVLAHRGNIRVESELNRGSSFFFSLPQAVETAVPNPAAV